MKYISKEALITRYTKLSDKDLCLLNVDDLTETAKHALAHVLKQRGITPEVGEQIREEAKQEAANKIKRKREITIKTIIKYAWYAWVFLCFCGIKPAVKHGYYYLLLVIPFVAAAPYVIAYTICLYWKKCRKQ